MLYLTEIIDEMTQVLKVIQKDRSLLTKYPKTAGLYDQRITVENLECLAGNHLFDDYPEWFDITEMEGKRIRAYFQMGAVSRNYDFVVELHKEFPDIFERERQEYLDGINKYRVSRGLKPISL